MPRKTIQRTFSDSQALAALEEIAAEMADALRRRAAKVYFALTDDERVAFASSDVRGIDPPIQSPGHLARTLLLAIAPRTLESGFDSETITPNVAKAKRIIKARPC
jgi:hypothetical protein